ncbi:hypothetical protein Ddc_15428 [Ditylenchus destructor]|nr:hypothetical protein Ddc_15428 [Ditylenchus destructor]
MKLYISFFVILLVTIDEAQLEDNNPPCSIGMSNETWERCGLSKWIDDQNMATKQFCIDGLKDFKCVHVAVEQNCGKESAKKFIQSMKKIVLDGVIDKIDKEVPECQRLMEYVKNGDTASTPHVTSVSMDLSSTVDPKVCGQVESMRPETKEKCKLGNLMSDFKDMGSEKFCNDGYTALRCVRNNIIEKCKPEPTKLFIQSLIELLDLVKEKIDMNITACQRLMEYVKTGGEKVPVDDFPVIPGITMINTPADLPKGSTEPVTRNCTNNDAEVTETTEGSNNHTDGPPHTDITETDGHNYAASTRHSWLQKLIMTAASCLAFRAARK